MKTHRLINSQVATYVRVDASLVTKWLKGSTVPGLESKRALSRHFKVKLSEIPGGSPFDEEEEPGPPPEVPSYLADLISQLDAPEQRSVAEMARTLLELREAKARYDGPQED